MSGTCREFEDDLPLYGEGQLEASRSRAVCLHILFCPQCRNLLEHYDALTREILETELGTAQDGTAGLGADRPFTDRVMAEVHRSEARARAGRLLPLAAAVLVIAGLSAAGIFWLRGLSPGSAPGAGNLVDLTEPASAVDREARGPEAAVEPSLASAWWIMDPEREAEAQKGREMEAALYALEHGREGHPVEESEYLLLQALFGAARMGTSAGGDPDLVMVPENGGAASAIPLRPVALPQRVSGRQIAEPVRVRLGLSARRYRIIWIGGNRLPVFLGPGLVPAPAAGPTGPSGEVPARNGIPILPGDLDGKRISQ